MVALAVTYLVVWLSTVFYVGRLAVRQNRLAKQIDVLQADMSVDGHADSRAQAA